MRNIVAMIASPRWLAFLLPWLMLLLLLGTVAQRYIGLYDAQRIFFSSWILWLGVIPTPGGITTLALITLSLTAKLLCYSPWSHEKAGIILSHLAILMLMLGGGITWLVNQEGHLTLLEGESTREMQDYFAREVQVIQGGKLRFTWPESALVEGTTLTHPALPFSLHIDDFCDNCASYVQENPRQKRGIARKIMLQDAPPAKEKEENKAGLSFTVKGKGYIAYELLPSQAPVIEGYTLRLTRKATPLPFTVKLLDFEKITYPGSDTAREYQSLVEIQVPTEQAEQKATPPSKARREAAGACPRGMQCWQTTISMNEPLRYRGYAIYQSSFIRAGDKEASVLAVVKNDAWLLPYLATFLLAVGLIWQVVLRRRGI